MSEWRHGYFWRASLLWSLHCGAGLNLSLWPTSSRSLQPNVVTLLNLSRTPVPVSCDYVFPQLQNGISYFYCWMILSGHCIILLNNSFVDSTVWWGGLDFPTEKRFIAWDPRQSWGSTRENVVLSTASFIWRKPISSPPFAPMVYYCHTTEIQLKTLFCMLARQITPYTVCGRAAPKYDVMQTKKPCRI